MVRLEACISLTNYFSFFVSIPIWCDWKNDSFSDPLKGQIVSIPIWCDWKMQPNPPKPSFRLFQFLYGAIGRSFNRSTSEYSICFNSYMVRLEAFSTQDNELKELSFNSYMVRLEVEIRLILSIKSPVSIPIWCDWKVPSFLK